MWIGGRPKNNFIFAKFSKVPEIKQAKCEWKRGKFQKDLHEKELDREKSILHNSNAQ
jgi:hypothetical protein